MLNTNAHFPGARRALDPSHDSVLHQIAGPFLSPGIHRRRCRRSSTPLSAPQTAPYYKPSLAHIHMQYPHFHPILIHPILLLAKYFLPPIPSTCACDLPVRPLLVQHTMSAVPASDRLAALQRDILIAVAALVVYCAGGGIDDGGVLRARLGGVVLLGGHGDAVGLGICVDCLGDSARCFVWICDLRCEWKCEKVFACSVALMRREKLRARA
jgi:hypothetical protein